LTPSVFPDRADAAAIGALPVVRYPRALARPAEGACLFTGDERLALEDQRARFNHAPGLTDQGFTSGEACRVPMPLRPGTSAGAGPARRPASRG
jgi:hypothetical protein